MLPPRSELKRLAKEDMRGASPTVYLVALGLLVITWLLGYLSYRIELPGISADLLTQIAEGHITKRAVAEVSQRPGFFGQLINLAITVLEIMLTVGFTSFCLNLSRGIAVGFGNLFDAFNNFFRMLWLNILIGIFTFLWSLLFVVPGIVAAYRYSMAVYILLDNPQMPAMDCIRASKQLTQGWKGKLFALDLSFLGWFILCAIPFVGIYVMPYYRLTHVHYYEGLCGDPYAGRRARQEQQTWNGGWNG